MIPVRLLRLLSFAALAKSLSSPLPRRAVLFGSMLAGGVGPIVANADVELPDRFDVENFLRTGVVPSPMGVSGQAGTSVFKRFRYSLTPLSNLFCPMRRKEQTRDWSVSIMLFAELFVVSHSPD